jgi:hypothetical protein
MTLDIILKHKIKLSIYLTRDLDPCFRMEVTCLDLEFILEIPYRITQKSNWFRTAKLLVVGRSFHGNGIPVTNSKKRFSVKDISKISLSTSNSFLGIRTLGNRHNRTRYLSAASHR